MNNIQDLLEKSSMTFGEISQNSGIHIDKLNHFLKTGELDEESIKKLYELLGADRDTATTPDEMINQALFTLLASQNFDFKHNLYNFLLCACPHYT